MSKILAAIISFLSLSVALLTACVFFLITKIKDSDTQQAPCSQEALLAYARRSSQSDLAPQQIPSLPDQIGTDPSNQSISTVSGDGNLNSQISSDGISNAQAVSELSAQQANQNSINNQQIQPVQGSNQVAQQEIKPSETPMKVTPGTVDVKTEVVASAAGNMSTETIKAEKNTATASGNKKVNPPVKK